MNKKMRDPTKMDDDFIGQPFISGAVLKHNFLKYCGIYRYDIIFLNG
jgi:hypothetical protein